MGVWEYGGSTFQECEFTVTSSKLCSDSALEESLEDLYSGYSVVRGIKKFYSGKSGNGSDYELRCKYMISSLRGVNGLRIRYLRCSSPGGKFINFCGLSVNTSSLLVGVGMDLDTNDYISMISLKDIINLVLFGDIDSGVLSDDDILYIVESFKLLSDKFDILGYVKGIVSKDRVQDVSKSVILNCVAEIEGKRSRKELPYFSKFSLSRDVLYEILSCCVNILKSIELLSRTFLKNMISEDDVASFLTSSNKCDISVLTSTTSGKQSLEALRVWSLSVGVDPLFLYGLSSYGLGKSKRKSVISASCSKGILDNNMTGFLFSVLSSMVYVEVYSDYNILDSVDIKKSFCYNLLDVLRASGYDHDLGFSLEILVEYRNDTLVKNIFGRLKLGEILDEMGITMKEFSEYALQYGNQFSILLDRGSMYSRKVRLSQYQMGSFSVPMIRNSGKLFEKMSERIIKKF